MTRFKRYLLPAIAVVGALIALGVVFWSQQKTPVVPILYPPAHSPYEHSIAGAGVVETSSLNITVGSPFNEIIARLCVLEGDRVKAGDILFELDTRAFEAARVMAHTRVEAARVDLEDKQTQFSFYERLQCKSAVSEQQYQAAYFAMKEAQEALCTAQADLQVAMTNIERSIIRSPIDAFILQVNIRPGESAAAVPFVSSEATMILLGNVNPLHMRIDIDEYDAWRYQKGARACAFVRGNSSISFPMEFVRVEPYIIPKASFTGDTIERVDTRVLQVLYQFDWGELPIYPGQILDIFIEVLPEKSEKK